MSDREKFEAWAVQRGWPVGGGTVVYTNPTTERMWEAWQASRRSALEEAAQVCEEKQGWYEEVRYMGQATAVGACAEEIRDLANGDT